MEGGQRMVLSLRRPSHRILYAGLLFCNLLGCHVAMLSETGIQACMHIRSTGGGVRAEPLANARDESHRSLCDGAPMQHVNPDLDVRQTRMPCMMHVRAAMMRAV